ncbi:MAG: Rpn family recombination-promoting nuclease/putative transposase [Alphaproteobacteria bacterium]|nr:Rpn family recombination-promoting nuclease/putative transposase [Alphaproteobacteria bacterium]
MTKKLSPHDRFTRSLMTNSKVAQEFFQKNLPEHIKKAIDFSSLELKKESYIDDKLKLQITDLLYSVRFNGREGFLYVLLEHASTPDRFLPFRMHKYISAIMEDHLKDKENKTLPLVYPIILYSGKKPYKHSMSFFDLFLENERELAKEIFISPYHLIDLTQVSDEELKQYMWFGTAALVLKHIHDPNIIPFFESIIEVLKELEKRGEEGYIYTVITYMAVTGKIPEKDEFLDTVRQLESIDKEKIMPTLVDHLHSELFDLAVKQAYENTRRNLSVSALSFFKKVCKKVGEKKE